MLNLETAFKVNKRNVAIDKQISRLYKGALNLKNKGHMSK